MRRLINIIHYAKIQRSPFLLLALDAWKASDQIHWGHLARILSTFSFTGPIFSAIMALYIKPFAQGYTSGILSTPFNITSGTLQGCPLSPLILILFMEPLASYINNHPHITGFKDPELITYHQLVCRWHHSHAHRGGGTSCIKNV